MLVIQGPQGIGKTTLFRKLAVRSDWLAEGVTLDMKNKDYIIQAVGVWIAELGELESTLKKEQASLKAFITQKMDRIRAPYAREATDRPRRTSFGATVNQEAFLRDETGARRFWVVPVEDMDTDELNRLPPEWFVQLWAEVYLWWWESPQGFRLSRTEREHLNQLNQQYQEALPGEEEIRQALDFDLPVEAWKEFSAAQFIRRCGRCLCRLLQYWHSFPQHYRQCAGVVFRPAVHRFDGGGGYLRRPQQAALCGVRLFRHQRPGG